MSASIEHGDAASLAAGLERLLGAGAVLTADADRCVLVDTRGLARVVEISTTDMYVTVEAGCTWQSLLGTGADSLAAARPFFRYYGPDLAGLFLGDSGARGIKARATLN